MVTILPPPFEGSNANTDAASASTDVLASLMTSPPVAADKAGKSQTR